MKTIRILRLLLPIVISTAAIAAPGDSPDDPILISTAAGLDSIRHNLDKHYRLAADIDLSDFTTDRGWTPIGTPDAPFTGSLDGAHHQITNLLIQREATGERMEICGHRGAPYDAPENTLASFNEAWRQGTDAIELDIFCTKDGRLAVIHDSSTIYTTGIDKVIAQSTFDELQTLTVNATLPNDPRFFNERIPALEDVLSTIPDGKVCYIEIKSFDAETFSELERVIAASGKTPLQLRFTSFSIAAVNLTKKRFPKIKSYLIAPYPVPPEKLPEICASTIQSIDGLDISYGPMFDASYVDYLNDNGFDFIVGVIDLLSEAKAYLDNNTQSLCTDRPARLRQQLQDAGLLSNFDSDHLGLFGYIRRAKITRLHLVAPQIYGRNRVGALVGWADAPETLIQSCSIQTGIIKTSGNGDTGGLVGFNAYGTITDCYSTAQVIGTRRVGGLVGQNHGTITRCYSTASVTGSMDVGGLVGNNWHAPVSDSFALNSSINAGGKWVGRTVGRNFGTSTSTETLFAFAETSCTGNENSPRQFSDLPETLNGSQLPSDALNQPNFLETLGFDFTGTWIFQPNTCPTLKTPDSTPRNPTDNEASSLLITTHPQGARLQSSGSFMLFVSASGTPPLSYQWQKDGRDIPGATDSSLLLSSLKVSHSGNYSVIVSDASGQIESNRASLLITPPPAPADSSGLPLIKKDLPPSLAFQPNKTATLKISVSSKTPVSYQWFRDGIPLPDSPNKPTLTLKNITSDNARTYHVEVTNTAGTSTSSATTLWVGVLPKITAQLPAKTECPQGGSHTFTITTTGDSPLHYQWLKNNKLLPSAPDSPTLTLDNLTPLDTANYSVRISNPVGKITSKSARLIVHAPPQIITQPKANLAIAENKTLTLSIRIKSTAPLSYSWQRTRTAQAELLSNTPSDSGAIIAGTSTASLKISKIRESDSGSYQVTVTNIAGASTSSPSIVWIGNAPKFTAKLLPATLYTGDTFAPIPAFTGTGPLSFQWLLNKKTIPGATTSNYAINNLTLANAGTYTLRITNPLGTSSAAAKLTVKPAPPAPAPLFSAASSATARELAANNHSPTGNSTFTPLAPLTLSSPAILHLQNPIDPHTYILNSHTQTCLLLDPLSGDLPYLFTPITDTCAQLTITGESATPHIYTLQFTSPTTGTYEDSDSPLGSSSFLLEPLSP